jgi:hypothetical protein
MTLIGRFLTGDYLVKRTASGHYVKGRYYPGPQEEIRVCGSLQPTSARELKLPEEGNRLKQYWKFYTDEPILTDSMKTLGTADKIFVNGDEYKAMAPLRWEGTNLDYFMTIIWREPEQSSDGKASG